ncbi:hypothetical protein Gohar_014812 [Gossypium harknessii]|uniref:Strictosidine synthase conserved region domain-containing protein n=1 Tax=Gossypium harknessii TaxID=34285 RepID=A0A7J9FXW5_9ROSI|nr:hypothetical protein [Gossypium harknessii]
MDSTGRLLKYDAKTKEVTVLFRNLSLAAGVAVDEEEKFVMVTDFTANRTRKITHFRVADPSSKPYSQHQITLRGRD